MMMIMLKMVIMWMVAVVVMMIEVVYVAMMVVTQGLMINKDDKYQSISFTNYRKSHDMS